MHTLTDKQKHLFSVISELFIDHFDKSGKPYINHLIYVADRSQQLAEQYHVDSEIAWIVGLCHDCYEDLTSDQIDIVDFTLQTLYTDCYGKIVHEIGLLTKAPEERHADYMKRVKTDKLATIVKAADTEHNGLLDRFDLSKYNDEQIEHWTSMCKMYQKRNKQLIKLLEEDPWS